MMTETLQRPVTEATAPRWRLVAFWLLMVVLLVLHLGERPQMLVFPFVAFDGGDHAGHEIHLFAQGVFAWLVLAAFAVHLRRPAARIGALWSITLGTVVAFGLLAMFADLPPEVGPILLAAVAVAVLALLAHPAPLHAKLASSARPSPILGALTLVGGVPLAVYAFGQLGIHQGSGPADEHYAFGHWVVMAAVALVPVALAAVAAVKVAGWRFPLWAAGLMVAALGVASLGLSAASQLSTPWAMAAVGWGVIFVAAGELGARRRPGSSPAV
jgi:hypothetical protein